MRKGFLSLIVGVLFLSSAAITSAATTDPNKGVNFSATHDSITFYIHDDVKLGDGGEFVVSCSSGTSAFTASSKTQRSTEREITLEGLKSNVEYNCLVRAIADKIISYDSQEIKVKTGERLRILKSKQGIDWVEITVNEVPLKKGEQYFASCHLSADENAIVPYVASEEQTITVKYLDWYSNFTCTAGIGTDIRKFEIQEIAQISENSIEVATKGKQDITPDHNISYTDSTITDWEEFNHPYPDVDPTSKWGTATSELYRRGIVNGNPDGEFKGANNVNRAEAAKFLLLTRYKQIPNFQNNYQFIDVPNHRWYTKFVMMAAHKDVIHGYKDGLFRPDNTVNTAEFIKMIARTFNLPQNLPYQYKDVPKNHWYAKYAGIAEKMELFPDRQAHLHPEQELTRYEVALAIYQAIKYIEAQGVDVTDETVSIKM